LQWVEEERRTKVRHTTGSADSEPNHRCHCTINPIVGELVLLIEGPSTLIFLLHSKGYNLCASHAISSVVGPLS